MMRHQSFLLGRATSFRLNAYDDADIADLIAQTAATGTPPTAERVDHVERAQDFITAAEGDPQLMLVYAFTLRWLNGYADLVWARFIEMLAMAEPLVVEDHYGQEHETGRIRLLFATYLLRRNLDPFYEYAHQYIDEVTLPTEAIIKGFIHVQHANTTFNRRIRDMLLEGTVTTNAKVTQLRACAETVPHPEAFLKAAAGAQVAAGHWDQAFIGSLRLVFGVR